MKKIILLLLSAVMMTIVNVFPFAVTAADWKTDANARIEQYRKRDARITVVNALGNPVSNVDVQVKQTQKAFPFGAAMSKNVLSNSQYQNFFKSHYNWAVFNNESKWYYNEPSQGNVTYADADAMYNWCQSNGISVRGHCIFWEPELWQPSWVKNLSGTALQKRWIAG